MSATAGWYPDPGGGQGLYRYWDGQAWSAATTGDPGSAAPPQGLVNPGSAAGTAGSTAHANYGQGSYGQASYGQGAYGQGGSAFGTGGASGGAARGPYGQAGAGGQPGQPAQPGQPPYAQFQKKRSGIGWWVGAGVLLLVLVVVAVFAIRAATSGGGATAGGDTSGQASTEACPPQRSDSPSPSAPSTDGRVHGGPVSYPLLPSPWLAPTGENRVPFGVNVLSQNVLVEQNYDGAGSDWVASVTIGELQAGDGFFTPQQGSQIVVKCILGAIYGKNQVLKDLSLRLGDVRRSLVARVGERRAGLVLGVQQRGTGGLLVEVLDGIDRGRHGGLHLRADCVDVVRSLVEQGLLLPQCHRVLPLPRCSTVFHGCPAGPNR